ncbi:hypothetical protein [Aureibacter tunicatorum]|uniref:Uncharacterized protein n=1 Tax=Aureibacter tunicatorum TaxID=866807 RepID=A0AAE3XSR5_9BACT|nr:hypothetical protein [Aureibacter tunicatorum]MDR6241201.1 hypothetical protein [Aureibacter tunicatorum]BDD03976.1 hypothetical protein AUTU_14590 [Aureibacter tunicatorum]
MIELQLTGGARIGMANATFPFATLKVNKDRLELNASIVGNLTFQSSDIISIEPYTMIPILGQGIKINHTVSNYKEQVIFWTFKNPKSVVQRIKETGFLSNENQTNQKIDRTILDKQAKGGFPIKKEFSIGAIIVWNLLFLTDFIPFFLGEREGIPIGNGVLTAIGLLFLTALLSLISRDFRRLILKEGRELSDIKKFAVFAMLISGFMFLQMGLMTKIIN